MNQCLPTPSFYTMRKLHSQSFFCRVSKASLRHNYPKSTSQINDRLHTIVWKSSISQISLPKYFGCFSLFFPIDFPPPLSLSFGDFWKSPRLDGGLRFGHRQLRKFLHKKATIMKPRIHGRLSALQMPGFLGQVFTMLLVLVRLMRRIWKKTLGLQ